MTKSTKSLLARIEVLEGNIRHAKRTIELHKASLEQYPQLARNIEIKKLAMAQEESELATLKAALK